MAFVSLKDLIADWGGFERLVADLHETGEVTVEHDAKLVGRSGAIRQIDVLIRHKKGLYEHLIIVECKCWNRAVDRATVDALATNVKEVGASKGVIFSTKGFQAGAVREARHQAIELFKLRELTDEEWGLPGRHLDLWTHLVAVSMANLKVSGMFTLSGGHLNFMLHLRLDRPASLGTSIIVPDSTVSTWEQLIERLTDDSLKSVYHPCHYYFEDGTTCGDVFSLCNVEFEPPRPMICFSDGRVVFIPKITFSLGVHIHQFRVQADKGNKYTFVLAVEDCLKKTVTTATRADGDQTTVLQGVATPLPERQHDPIVVNGSVMTIRLAGFHPFDMFEAMTPGVPVLRSTPAIVPD